MDRSAITDHYLTAGSEYLEALRRLDLDPEGLMWAVDTVSGQKVLLLITSLFDIAGPLKLSELLFRAYNASATPKDISPFIVEMHSPQQDFVDSFYSIYTIRIEESGTGKMIELGPMNLGPYTIFRDWVYQFRAPSMAKPSLDHRFRRFERKVQALKAA